MPLSWFAVILGKVPPRKPRGTFLFRDVNRACLEGNLRPQLLRSKRSLRRGKWKLVHLIS